MILESLILATSELWCIAPGQAATANAAMPALPSRQKEERYPDARAYGLVEIVGTLTKPRMVAMRERVAALAGNPGIGEIVLLVDSPGGTAAGCHDLYLTVSAAAARKRVVAVIEDQATSAALYAIAGATEIIIGETALTGSIGCYCVVIDESKLLERIGVEVLVIRSGEHKGAGVSGARISQDQLAELKRRVDVQARHFVGAIARGRRMKPDRAAELADGRVFIGREAIAAGLADRVGMFEDVLAEAHRRTSGLLYRDLRGKDAAEKLEKLVAQEMELTRCTEATCRERVRLRYTSLADAVAEHEGEKTDKLRRENTWRR
jgi:protease-4